MKNRRVHFVFVVVAFIAVGVVLTFAVRGSSQSKSRDTKSPVKPTVFKPKNAKLSAFTEAAVTNSSLRNDLSWTFGGKTQRGWYLYDSLIGRTLKTESDPTSTDFAAALADWQKERGLNASGILDEDILMSMISQWQNNRLKDRTSASVDQLVTAPPSDFYDPARLPELRPVQRNAYDAYRKMIAAAIADPTLKLAHNVGELAPQEKFLKIISAFRSPEYQEKLRRAAPNAGSAGLAVNSPHFTGRALDLYVGGDPVDTKDSNRAIQVKSAAYQWLVKNAERFGFRPYFYEPWHWEYVK